MATTFFGRTRQDATLVRWLRDSVSTPRGAIATVTHGTREDATVPKGHLVETQHRLPDGRLVRVMHASPRSKGDKVAVHYLAQAPEPADA